MSEKLHFFDIASSLKGPRQSWSPNTLKTRLILNYKLLPSASNPDAPGYTQSYISYPDIRPLLLSLSLPPHPSSATSAPYTLPAISHPSSLLSTATTTNKNPKGVLNNSWPLALHLEHTFPQPTIFPSGQTSYALALAVQHILASGVVPAGYGLVIPYVADMLDERGRNYFVRTRTKTFGGVSPRDMGDQSENGEEKDWAKLEKAIDPLINMLRGIPESLLPSEGGGQGRARGPFFEGDKVGYADFLVVAYLGWFERANKSHWERLVDLGDGELRRLWEASEGWLEGQGETREWEWEGKGGVPEFEGE